MEPVVEKKFLSLILNIKKKLYTLFDVLFLTTICYFFSSITYLLFFHLCVRLKFLNLNNLQISKINKKSPKKWVDIKKLKNHFLQFFILYMRDILLVLKNFILCISVDLFLWLGFSFYG